MDVKDSTSQKRFSFFKKGGKKKSRITIAKKSKTKTKKDFLSEKEKGNQRKKWKKRVDQTTRGSGKKAQSKIKGGSRFPKVIIEMFHGRDFEGLIFKKQKVLFAGYWA